jgi:CRP-like cAMP-binding protein
MDWQESFQRYLVRYSKGEIIFHEGDLGNEMYVIQSGRVRIFKNIGGMEQTLAVLEKGDFFGEMAVLEGVPRTASAEVEEDCELIRINSANFVAMIRANPEIALRIMRKLSIRLRETTEQLQRLMQVSTAVFSSYDAPPVQVTPESSPEGEQPVLAYLISTATGRTYPITKDVAIIGRYDKVTGLAPDVDLTEEDPHRYVSRRHAVLLYEEGQWKLIEEIGTINGTFLNKKRIPNGVPVPLQDGDQVTFANVTLTFRVVASSD